MRKLSEIPTITIGNIDQARIWFTEHITDEMWEEFFTRRNSSE